MSEDNTLELIGDAIEALEREGIDWRVCDEVKAVFVRMHERLLRLESNAEFAPKN